MANLLINKPLLGKFNIIHNILVNLNDYKSRISRQNIILYIFPWQHMFTK